MNKLILVDDEYYIRQMLLKSIPWSQMGYEVVAELEDGISALKAVQKFQPEAALIDINIPHLSGLELISRITEECPHVCTVILTAYDKFNYAQHAIRLNVFDYLLKPIDPTEVEQTFTRMKSEIERRKTECANHVLQSQQGDQGFENLVKCIQRDILTDYQNEKLSVKALADRYHVNQNYLCTLFKRCTGHTIMEELIERRMQIASTLVINNPGMPFAEVANAVGYSDPLYFSKAFKKRFGMSPKNYKNINSSSEKIP